jgi:hypothetical protein
VRPYTVGGGNDAFAAKLDSSGNLIWNTFLGGTGTDETFAVAVDGTGNVYVAGFTAGLSPSPSWVHRFAPSPPIWTRLLRNWIQTGTCFQTLFLVAPAMTRATPWR